ncbi:MOSC domain-containing protein [Caulobacter sp. DWR2-3-1b2]|uniref:MOSC domain-containing protein n=1 Tax=unclassified Caulobacter TaxID=2648921 RepID=UPI003CF9C585
MSGGLNPASPLARLMAGAIRPGHVMWLGARPARHAPLVALDAAEITRETGLVGDHYNGRPNTDGKGGKRQVTLIQAEDLAAIASYLDRDVTPQHLRRNIVVEGINLRALKNRRFQVGEVVLEDTGDCHPCSRMEEILGPGGYNAVRGHGGITARVITGGLVRLGDPVRVVETPLPLFDAAP